MTGKWAWLAVGVLAVALAYAVVDRLDGQSLAFLSGAFCGATAGIPIAAVFFWFYQRTKAVDVRPPEVRERPPQMVVIPPGPHPYAAVGQAPYAVPARERPTRECTIVGEEGREDELR